MAHDLVDEYVLLIHPLVLGTGRRLFADGGPPSSLRLESSATTTTGVIMATLRPSAGRRTDDPVPAHALPARRDRRPRTSTSTASARSSARSTTSCAPRARGSSPAACTRRRPPRSCAPAATTSSSPTARTSRARSTSAASRSSRPRTSTRRCAGPSGSRASRRSRSRCGRSSTRRVVTADVDRVFREEHGRAVAVLTRVFGDLDVAEDAVQEAFAEALRELAGGRRAARAGGLDHHDRAAPRDRPAAARGGARGPPGPGRAAARARGRFGGGRRGGRAAAPDLHLLPSGARARRPGRADAAAAGRALDRRGRPRVPGAGDDDGAAARAGEAEDPRRADPVPGARRRRPARAAARPRWPSST